MDVLAIADALAAKFASGTLTPPTGYGAIRVATARTPNAIPVAPFLLVTLPSGEVIIEGQWAKHHLDFDVEFHWAQHSGDKPRDMTALLDWLPKLLTAVLSGWQLGITGIQKTLPMDYEYDVMPYAGVEFYGWRIRHRVYFDEAQTVTA